mmetsp:Transcript_106422/g.270312  ORF Transcript_106422/g.270312 Transcript_106422/m.270312 type:complete len:81 (-) Transcript_106422:281-523(-)
MISWLIGQRKQLGSGGSGTESSAGVMKEMENADFAVPQSESAEERTLWAVEANEAALLLGRRPLARRLEEAPRNIANCIS